MKCFGRSLHVDCYGCTVDGNDVTFFHDLLRELAKFLGMTEQAPPFVFKSPDAFPEKEGVTGFLPLNESGISVHTITPKAFVSFDVYTCGKLEPATTAKWLADKVGSESYELAHLNRGTRYYS